MPSPPVNVVSQGGLACYPCGSFFFYRLGGSNGRKSLVVKVVRGSYSSSFVAPTKLGDLRGGLRSNSVFLKGSNISSTGSFCPTFLFKPFHLKVNL